MTPDTGRPRCGDDGRPIIRAPRVLDAKGRCCGVKPIVYKRPTHRLFCVRCSREYSPQGEQRPNWAWLRITGGFTPRYPGPNGLRGER